MPRSAHVTSTAKAHWEAQRSKILDAAEQRFIEHGFHAANMAGIAAQAGISPGLIYRYFDSKQTIVFEIIERHLARNREALEQLKEATDVIDGLAGGFEMWSRGESTVWHAVLVCEATAEASRHPALAKLLGESDRMGREAVQAWLQRGAPASASSSSSPGARALLLQCLAEGLAMRAIREPELDRALLRQMLAIAAGCILQDPC